MTLRSTGIDAHSVAYDSPDLVSAVLQRAPDVVLLDLFLGPDAGPSLAALAAFVSVGVRVLVVTATSDRLLHARCLEAGASGVIEKSAAIEALIDGTHRVLRQESVVSQSKSLELLNELASSRRARSEPGLLPTLTPRERDVLHSLTLGYPARRIARDHNTSIATVRTHIRSILFKLDVHSQLEAVSMAMRLGWFA